MTPYTVVVLFVQAPPLYVRYATESVPGPANRLPIRLSASKDSSCRWTTAPLLARDRLEGLGSPVPVMLSSLSFYWQPVSALQARNKEIFLKLD